MAAVGPPRLLTQTFPPTTRLQDLCPRRTTLTMQKSTRERNIYAAPSLYSPLSRDPCRNYKPIENILRVRSFQGQCCIVQFGNKTASLCEIHKYRNIDPTVVLYSRVLCACLPKSPLIVDRIDMIIEQYTIREKEPLLLAIHGPRRYRNYIFLSVDSS